MCADELVCGVTYVFTRRLDFVLDLAKNGELRTRISELGSLSIDCVRYYTAQMVDAVAYMHSKDIIHRYVFYLTLTKKNRNTF